MDFVPQSLTGNRVSANTRPRVRIPPFPPSENGIPFGVPFLLRFDYMEGFERSVKQTVRGTVCSGDRRILRGIHERFAQTASQNSRANPSLSAKQRRYPFWDAVFVFCVDRENSNRVAERNLAPSAQVARDRIPPFHTPRVSCRMPFFLLHNSRQIIHNIY